MKKAWFVDDDQEMARAIKLLLSLLGYDMTHYHQPRSAARAFHEGRRPDILFLDISMPEINGIDMLEFVRRQPQLDSLPVVMLSSEYSDSQIDQALGLGADAYVTKPVTLEELEKAIEKALARRSGSPPAAG